MQAWGYDLTGQNLLGWGKRELWYTEVQNIVRKDAKADQEMFVKEAGE